MRRRRLYVPGLSAHVFQRGHNRSVIFDEASDYDHFVALMRHSARRYGTDVHAFALMSNHYHLMATPSHAKALPETMKAIDCGYTKYYNHKHGRMGTLWNARYRSKLIQDEGYWLTCLRYVELNPLRAPRKNSSGVPLDQLSRARLWRIQRLAGAAPRLLAAR